MSYSNYHSRKIPAFVSYLAALMRYRHLCWNLVGSDLRSRFRRSSLGMLWAVIQPLGYSLIIAWAWGAVFNDQNYWQFAVYVYSGLVVWEYFANCVYSGLDGLMSAVGYLRQARIPLFVFQLRVPLAGVATMLCALAGLVLLMTVLELGGVRVMPVVGPQLLLVLAFIPIIVAFMTPVAIIFSVLGAQLRDLRHIMALAIQLLFFLSPVMLRREFLDLPHLEPLKYLNPMVPLLDMFRAPLLKGEYWNQDSVITVCAWGAGLWLVAGIISARAGRKVVFAI